MTARFVMANLTDENNKYSKAAILICATKETGIILNITIACFLGSK
jgi:hypothetical protein